MTEFKRHQEAKPEPASDAQTQPDAASPIYLTNEPAYLDRLRRSLVQNRDVFTARRGEADETINRILNWLKSDVSLVDDVRQQFVTVFEHLRDDLRKLEEIVPQASEKALLLLNKLDNNDRTSRT